MVLYTSILYCSLTLQEQADQARRAEEKRQKRIYDNWKKLIQGILVRERVRDQYGGNHPSDDDEKQVSAKKTETKKKGEDKKKKVTKRKIKQEDIDAARPPPMVTHQVPNLAIDLNSSVVEMAKKSRQTNMRKHSAAIQKEESMGNSKFEQVKNDVMKESSSESESDQEEKKEKIRAILQWGTKGAATNPDLSDDSDRETGMDDLSPSLTSVASSNPYYNAVIQPKVEDYRKRKKKLGKLREIQEHPSDSEEDELSASSSRSTTPEPSMSEKNLGPRRTSSRSLKLKVQTYKESEGESSEDISVDESDCEDKSYDPQKERKING